jgi:hypothetical protein
MSLRPPWDAQRDTVSRKKRKRKRNYWAKTDADERQQIGINKSSIKRVIKNDCKETENNQIKIHSSLTGVELMLPKKKKWNLKMPYICEDMK